MMTRIALFAAAAALALPLSANAANLTWNAGGDGTTWNDANNWGDDDNAGAPGVPTASDDIHLSSATIEVNADATYANGRSGSGGTININSGATLTPTGATYKALRYLSGVHAKNGGTLDAPASAWVRTTITIDDGAVFTGTNQARDGKTITVGGTWRPIGNDSGNLIYSMGSPAGHVLLLSTGTIELDVFGNGVNEYFNIIAGSNLNLADGTIKLVAQGYVPQAGDSFDLWNDDNTLGTLTLGDGSNIVLDGYTLDTSNFATTGVVTVIPEPASVALLGLAGIAVVGKRRR